MSDVKTEVLESVMALAQSLHPEVVERLASNIRRTGIREGGAAYYGGKGEVDANEDVRDLLELWRSTDMSPDELAGMLVGASQAYRCARSELSVELVWSGPPSELVATRRTEQVMVEVIGEATKKVFLTSFVAYRVGSILRALSAALERGVEVSILLESSEVYGGGVSVDSIDTMQRALPEAKLYYWSDKSSDFAGGKVHAKVIVVDARVCFISSANLTEHAMERNMEAGVLIEGGSVPERLHRHLLALVAIQRLSRVGA